MPPAPAIGPPPANPLLEAALTYARRGWRVFPLAPGKKTPLFASAHPKGDARRQKCRGECGRDGHGFYDATTDTTKVIAWWRDTPRANIGVRTGEPSGIDVLDLDEKDGRHGRTTIGNLESDFGQIETLTSGTPSRGLHLVFEHADGVGCGTEVLPGCDLRGDGGYIVAPPSVVGGRSYRWLEGQDPLRSPIGGWPPWLLNRARPSRRSASKGLPPPSVGTPTDESAGTPYGLTALRAEAHDVAAAPEGTRNDRLNSAAFACGQLLAGGELRDEAVVRSRLAQAAAVAGLDGIETSATIESGLRAGSASPRTSYAALRSSGRGGFGTGTTSSVAQYTGWKPFPIDVFPPACRALVVHGSRSMGVDPAFFAVPMLGALAGAIGNARVVRAKRSYAEPIVVWAATVAPSGAMKSPPLDWVLAAHRARDQELLQLNESRREAHQMSLTQYERERRTFMGKSGKGGVPPVAPKDPPMLATLVDDVTVEALVKRLVDNPRGLLLALDELSAFFGSMDVYKKSKGSDVSKYLTMHRAGSVKVDRKGGGTLFVSRAALSVVGTIQPRTLRRLLTEEYLANGFGARLLFAMPPCSPPRWTADDIEEDVTRAYAGVVRDLLGLSMQPTVAGTEPVPGELRLDEDAARLWPGIHDRHADRMRGAGDDLGAAFSKLRGGIVRFAGLLALARGAERASAATVQVVTAEDLSGADQIGTWCEDEAERVYAMLSATEEDNLLQRDEELVRSLGGTVSVRDLTHAPSRTYRARPEAAQAALDRLADAGRGTWTESPSGPRGGRKTRRLHLRTQRDTGGTGTETPQVVGAHSGDFDTQSRSRPSSDDDLLDGGFGTTPGVSAPPGGDQTGAIDDADSAP